MRTEDELKHALDIAEGCAWKFGMIDAIMTLKWALGMTDETPWNERDALRDEEEEATAVPIYGCQVAKEPMKEDKPILTGIGNAWWRKK